MYNVLGATGSEVRANAGIIPNSENFPDEHTLGNWPIGGGSASLSVNAEEEKGDDEVLVDLGRHPYGHKETLALYDAWPYQVTVSYNTVVGNQQTRLCLWEKVTELYNSKKPKGTHRHNMKMLRGHWDRYDKDVKKFCAIYREEAANYQSGASGADILRAALRVFKDDTDKDFKHVDVWSQVHHLERWAGGVPSCTRSNSKRSKHTTGGQYSSSEGGSGNPSQEVEGRAPDAEGPSGSRRRPQGGEGG
ncbi:uncharacterized protein LOC125210154 [Salvia hispanica]|uniref:uncharacterized protein LOC125210154 n=1 Tax=Salvia hispanica TaxID=49212 RepID=UPI00200987F1|nr:uncharacterized protein LOC125210154 [Salvia hispanica]